MDGIGVVIDHLKCEAKELPAPRHPGPILSRFPHTRLEVRRSAVGISVRVGQDGVAPRFRLGVTVGFPGFRGLERWREERRVETVVRGVGMAKTALNASRTDTWMYAWATLLLSCLVMASPGRTEGIPATRDMVEQTMSEFRRGHEVLPTRKSILRLAEWPPPIQGCGYTNITKPDPKCQKGVKASKSSACCPSHCKTCDCISSRPAECCPMAVKYSGRMCEAVGAPCMTKKVYLRLKSSQGGVMAGSGNLWDDPVETISGTLTDAWKEAEMELFRKKLSNSSDYLEKREIVHAYRDQVDDIPVVQESTALLLVAVAGKWEDLSSGRLPAAVQSWVRDVRGFAFVTFFVGNPRGRAVGPTVVLRVENWKVVRLPVVESYPPLELHHALLNFLYATTNLRNKHAMYLFLDMDTYVNPHVLRKTIPLLITTSSPLYQGLAVRGRRQERRELEMRSKYCAGGAGWFGNSNLLRLIGPFLDELLAAGKNGHSDVEIGRLVYNLTEKGCADPPFEMIEIFTITDGEGVAGKIKLNRRKQITGDMHTTPPLRYYRALTVHPIKSIDQYLRFHFKVRGYLLGVHIPPCAGQNFKHFLNERHDFLKSCTHNPGLQMAVTGTQMPECPASQDIPPDSSQSSLFKDTYIVSIRRDRRVLNWFKEWGTKMNANLTEVAIEKGGSFDILGRLWQQSQNEKARPLLYLKVFQDALRRGVERIAIFEDTLQPELDFPQQLSRLCDEPRCTSHLHTKHKGGVLILSTCQDLPDGTYPMWKMGLGRNDMSNWFDGALLREDEVNTYASLFGRSRCYNVGWHGACMRAGIYHRQVFEQIIDWLEIHNNTQLDTVLPVLAYQGFPVRVAHPALFYQ